ncbi:MAG: NADH-quinone oxidoreductase subunit L [Candidatus Sumerlaeaceae bacterium]|nr:NADH-quinone oxidoreductase subunit L [Candidatus Sumerlaeaceae bacterium]
MKFSPETLALALIILPLAGFAVVGLFGRRLPRYGDWLATGIMGIVLALGLVLFSFVFQLHSPVAAFRWISPWFDPRGNGIKWPVGVLVDNLSATMVVVVATVSFLVHLYSIGYMHGDPKYVRFFAALQLFSAAMLGLVLSDNLLTLYISWEIMGFCSYLLIGHYFEKPSAANACLKAFMTTRVGDVLMFAGILILYWQVGSLRFADIFAAVKEGTLAASWRTVIGLLLFGGAVGKSAQFPLHVWLPDAMEGPTPVSALIHAATMVAAGVYLMARSYLILTPETFLVVAYIGGFTAIFAATMGVVMDDIKKVLAYSTISQLGYMMLGLGVGGFVASGYTAGVYHLTTHAFFKACLFLGSGSVIHALHTQNLSEMGGLRRKMPITFVTFLIATLALTGLPPFSGFFTKDSIIAAALELVFLKPQHGALALFAMGAACLTSFYMFRLIFLAFFGKPRDEHAYHHAHESPWVMTLPLIVLACLSIYPIGGGHGNWFWTRNPAPQITHLSEWLGPPTFAGGGASGMASGGTAPPATEDVHSLGSHNEHLAHRAHNYAVIGSLTAFFIGFALAWATYMKRWINAAAVAQRCSLIHRVLLNKYYIDEFYVRFVTRPFLVLCRWIAGFDLKVIDGIVNATGWCTKLLSRLVGLHDRFVVDGLVNGVGQAVGSGGRVLSQLQSGRVGQYLAAVGIGVIFLAGFMLWILGSID